MIMVSLTLIFGDVVMKVFYSGSSFKLKRAIKNYTIFKMIKFTIMNS